MLPIKRHFKINKKSLIILLVFTLIFSIVTYAQKDKSLPEQAAKGKDAAQAQKEKFCETDDIEQSLKKILYLHLTEPDSVPLTLDEAKDLLGFYLNIEEGAATARCSAAVLGFLSKKPILDIVNIGINLPNRIPTCSDGTKYGKCSISKPLHCTARGMIDGCQKCGCPSGSVCSKSTGKCTPTGQTIICSSDLDCGKSGFTGNYYCNNNYITKDYVNYTCENPGTANSRCVSATSSMTLDYCDPNLNKLCVDGAGSCQVTAVTCSDGTQNGQCSLTKPLYCKDGALVNNCGVCGCAKGKVCSPAGTCIDKTTQTAAKIEIVRITTNAGDKGNPAIYGDKIVWQDYRNGYRNADIYMYDLSTKQEIQITKNTADQKYPAIYGDKIVWTDYRNGSNWDVYMYDLSTGTETQITTDPAQQQVSSIYENKIAWTTRTPYNSTTRSSSDIYLYDLATGQTTQITTSPGSQFYPLIYGNKIVWTDDRNRIGFNSNEDIYMYDLSTGQETPITTAPYFQFLTDFDGNKIAWLDSRNAGVIAIYEIYTYDLSTRQEMRIPANATYSLWDAAVYGDKLVLNDYRNGNYDIYMYDFSTGKETQITSESAEQADPDIYENKIVWTDYRNYWGDIYMAIIS